MSGLKASAKDWNIAERQAPTVFAEVAKFTRVCAYDRPGTPVGEKPSRSDPVRQPTTAQDAASDLHALLSAAKEPTPYVMVGHSYGGLVAKLYARIYPQDVSDLVLVDALTEGLQEAEPDHDLPPYTRARKAVKSRMALASTANPSPLTSPASVELGKLVFAPLGGQDQDNHEKRRQRDRDFQPRKRRRIDRAIAKRAGEQIQTDPAGHDDGEHAEESGPAN